MERARTVHERDAGQVALQVLGEAGAVGGVVQHGIDVVEDVPPLDARVVVEVAEVRDGFGGHVLAPLRAVCGIREQGQTIAE